MGWLQDTVQNFWLIDSRVITEHYGHFNQGKGRSPPPFKYLESLPNTIPQLGSETTKYGFNLVDNDDLEDRGLVGTFNCQRDSRVKIHLYHCNNGPIISRKGQVSPSWSPQAGLPKLTDLFESWLDELASDPEVLILFKCVTGKATEWWMKPHTRGSQESETEARNYLMSQWLALIPWRVAEYTPM